MRGPIDYIIVGIDGPKFDGSILSALATAIDSGAVALVTLSIVAKDTDGVVTTLDVADAGDSYIVEFAEKYQTSSDLIDQDDIDEVGELLANNSAAGLLVVEQLWAKPLKKALLDANAYVLAEGRIHPDAAAELNEGATNMPGLLRGMARTAAIVGTANAVTHNQQQRYAAKDQAAYAEQQAAAEPAAAAPVADDTSTQIAELQQLAQLKDQGILTQEEFDAKKKQILGL